MASASALTEEIIDQCRYSSVPAIISSHHAVTRVTCHIHSPRIQPNLPRIAPDFRPTRRVSRYVTHARIRNRTSRATVILYLPIPRHNSYKFGATADESTHTQKHRNATSPTRRPSPPHPTTLLAPCPLAPIVERHSLPTSYSCYRHAGCVRRNS